MTSYECLEQLNVKIHYPSSFPRHDYWHSSLQPWWASPRRVRFSEPPPPPPFATVTKDYLPVHKFQVPCDTISPGVYYGASSAEPQPACSQKMSQIDIIR